VLAPEDEAGQWFSWPVPRGSIQKLVDAGRLTRVSEGWLTA
jgi:hypothetical protein